MTDLENLKYNFPTKISSPYVITIISEIMVSTTGLDILNISHSFFKKDQIVFTNKLNELDLEQPK